MRVTHAQLAQQFGAAVGFAQSHYIADIAAAVLFYHTQPAADRVQLKVGDLNGMLGLGQVGTAAHIGVVEFVQRLEIDMVRRRVRQRPRVPKLRYEDVADVGRFILQRVEPVAQCRHFGIAGNAHIQFGIAAKARQREIGRADDRRARLGVIFVPAQIRLGVERAFGI